MIPQPIPMNYADSVDAIDLSPYRANVLSYKEFLDLMKYEDKLRGEEPP